MPLLAAHGPAAAMLLGVGLGLLFFLLVRKRGGLFFAAVVALVAILAACAIGEDASVGAAVPALIGLAAAYAFASDAERDLKSCLRALVPAALAVLLALLLVPQGRLTWAPLENAADSLRNAFEDYFRFSEVRQTFSLQERGYNYTIAGEDGEPEPRLGGPADPDTTPVMRVRADGDLLLRGTIRRDYTGYSWVDTGEKARYLYYDFTRRGTRAEIFDSDAVPGGEAAFASRTAEVEMLDGGTSTLFAAHRLTDFSMALQNAVYYNSIGEVFLARNVEAGDEYAFTALAQGDEAALARADAWSAPRRRTRAGRRRRRPALPCRTRWKRACTSLAAQITAGAPDAFSKAVGHPRLAGGQLPLHAGGGLPARRARLCFLFSARFPRGLLQLFRQRHGRALPRGGAARALCGGLFPARRARRERGAHRRGRPRLGGSVLQRRRLAHLRPHRRRAGRAGRFPRSRAAARMSMRARDGKRR